MWLLLANLLVTQLITRLVIVSNKHKTTETN